ncbi:MAG: sulfatase [Rhodothermales bacterium]|nr:sulfatase [Rhodothermales bacterium]
MHRVLATFLLLALALGCDSKPPAAAPASLDLGFRPNILWLVAEDLSPIIPPFGDSTVATPTLSRLAAEGVRYTHVFSPSGVCAPSRAALATGLYQTHMGAMHMRTGGDPRWLPPGLTPYEAMPPVGVKLHSEYLREAGYYATNAAKEDYQFTAPVTAWDESSADAHWRNRAPGQPFFAVINFGVTHESQVWSRANDSLWVPEDLDVPVPPYLPDNAVGRRDIRQVYSNIKTMDDQVGQALAELEAAGLMDSTIVVWYADNGGPLPRQKRLVYDSGLRVPMIIRYPGQWRAGEVDDRLISFVDFKPTLLSMVGIEPPDYVDGQAFEGEFAAAEPRAYIHGAADRFDEQYDMIRAVRNHQFKYLRNFQPEKPYYLPVAYREQMPIMQELLRMRDAGELDEYQAQWFRPTKAPEELFDILADPHELHNLAGDPAYAATLAALRAECDRWMAEIGDGGSMPEMDFLATIWPDGTQPVTAPPASEMVDGRLALTSATDGASIGYQRLADEEAIGRHWEVYTGPIPLDAGERIVSVAHRIGFVASDTVDVRSP